MDFWCDDCDEELDDCVCDDEPYQCDCDACVSGFDPELFLDMMYASALRERNLLN